MINNLQKIIDESNSIVFFGGAGVSTESGIPDFRSVDGLYHQTYQYPPEIILSHTFFLNHTEEFYDFYRDKMIYKDVRPNQAHIALAKMEEVRKLKAVITQNIDGLHQLAGSKKVIELHGSILRNYCGKCGASFDLDYINNSEGIPTCDCGGIIKPGVVLYEEPLNHDAIEQSVEYIKNAEVLIIGGTSLNVYPAAGLIDYFKGNSLVLINKSATPADDMANLVIHEPIGSVMGSLKI